MNKLELIKIHLILFQVKQFLEQNHVVCNFNKYDALNVSPMHVHKSRKEHRKAILLLGKAISKGLAQQRDRTSSHQTISEEAAA